MVRKVIMLVLCICISGICFGQTTKESPARSSSSSALSKLSLLSNLASSKMGRNNFFRQFMGAGLAAGYDVIAETYLKSLILRNLFNGQHSPPLMWYVLKRGDMLPPMEDMMPLLVMRGLMSQQSA